MKVEFINRVEAESIKRRMPKSKTALEFEGYVKGLRSKENAGMVGKLVVDSEGDAKPNSAKVRLIRAGKSLGIPVKTKRTGNMILFWEDKNVQFGEGKSKTSKQSKKQD